MVISILLKTGTVEFFKHLNIDLIAKKQLFKIKILNDIDFFLIIIYIQVGNG